MQYCSVQNIKDSIQTIPSFITDEKLEDLIEEGSAQIDLFCRRTIGESETTKTYHVKNDRLVFLDNYPITSISEITNTDMTGETSDVENYFIADAEKGIVGFVSPLREGFLSVTSVAGYDEIPTAIKSACIDYVKTKIDSIGVSSVLNSESIGDYSYSAKDKKDIENNFKSKISGYKKID